MYVRVGSFITVRIKDRTYYLSKTQAEFLLRIADSDTGFLDKMFSERRHAYYRTIFKLKRKGLIDGRGRPYRLTPEGEAVVRVLRLALGGGGSEV